MDEPKKILVPVDLSERSRIGVGYAAMLAEHLGATLILMANVNMPELAVIESYAADNDIDVNDAGPALLMSWAEELAPGVKAKAVLAHRDFPAEGVLAVANEQEVDMIVIASHGRTGMTRWLLGSVADKVARSADVPVVMVPARAR